MILTKINPIGIWYWHRFQLPDGSLKLVETTKADYDQLKNPNFEVPKMAGAIWDSSVVCLKYDTLNSWLNNGEYFIEPQRAVFKHKGIEISCSPSDIVDDILINPKLLKIVKRIDLTNL